MKEHIALICTAVAVAGTAQGAVVFSDDFSETSGTTISGKAPDVGENWTGDTTATITVGNSLGFTASSDSSGNQMFANFEAGAALGAGQVLTLSYDINSIELGGGWGGVSLFHPGGELFTGSPNTAGDLGTNLGTTGDIQNTNNSAIFTYEYDSGDWTFVTANESIGGTTDANRTLDQLRVAGDQKDMDIDNLTVDISAVPEPSSTALFGLAGLALMLRRRK
jgi:hypothetical protein